MESIFQLFADDKDALASIVLKFIEKLTELQKIEAVNLKANMSTLHTLSHQLKITAGLFEEEQLSTLLSTLSDDSHPEKTNWNVEAIASSLSALQRSVPNCIERINQRLI